jgi:hypothetical protein
MCSYVKDDIRLAGLIIANTSEENIVIETVCQDRLVGRPFPVCHFESAEMSNL